MSKYMKINMENIYKELTNTCLEIARLLELNVDEKYVSVVDEIEFIETNVKDIDERYSVFYEISKDDSFYFSIERKHMQYNFDTDIMYGFYTWCSCSMRVSGSQEDKSKWHIVSDCVEEVHNRLNYKKGGE